MRHPHFFEDELRKFFELVTRQGNIPSLTFLRCCDAALRCLPTSSSRLGREWKPRFIIAAISFVSNT